MMNTNALGTTIAQNTLVSRAASSELTQQRLPINTFIPHEVPADGDCLFRSFLMGFDERPGHLASPEAVIELRQRLSAYLSNHYDNLQHSDVFGGGNMLADLYQLLITPRSWSDDAGDLVPSLLAQVLKREVNIVEPIAGSADYQIKISLPPSRADLPAVPEQQGGAPIYLLYTGENHYTYLQKVDGDSSENSNSESDAAIDADDFDAAQQLLGLGRSSDELESEPLRKKARSNPQQPSLKQELLLTEISRCPQPLLIPGGGAKRLYFSSTVDLSRAQTYTDLSGTHVETRTRIPVTIIPSADSKKMSLRPIIQAPDNPDQPHPEIPQPVTLNPKGRVRSRYTGTPALKQALKTISDLLANPKKRQIYERNAFALRTIKADNLPQQTNSSAQQSVESLNQPTIAGGVRTHPTVGMRGVVAHKALAMGSPLQYSAQYLSKEQWTDATQELATRLCAEAGFSPEQAQQEAGRLLLSYSWDGIRFNGQQYELSAFGAGNITSMINHDEQLANMGVAYLSTLDQDGNAGPRLVVYFALRDIAQKEQLLVDYGQLYDFTPAIEHNIDRQATPEESLLSEALLSLSRVKSEKMVEAASSASKQVPLAEVEAADATVPPLSAAAVKVMQKYQQPPEGYAGFSDLKKQNIKAGVRRSLRRYHLSIPEWAMTKRDYVPKGLKKLSTLPEKYLQPPEGYEEALESEKIVIRRRFRRMVKQFNSPMPEWLTLRATPQTRPPLIDPIALEQPQDYQQVNRHQQVFLRRRAREAAQLQRQPIPEWAKERYTSRLSALEMPEGYKDMTVIQRGHYRASTRIAAEKLGQPIPEWAKKIRERRVSALEKPENYEQLSRKQQQAARYHAVRAAKTAGKEIPEWALKEDKNENL